MSEARQPKADSPAQQPAPLKLSRVFHIPRATVFRAWTSAEHVKNWFSPETYTVPEAKVEMHVGGAFDVLMRSSSGQDHWSRGKFIEIVPNTRLVLEGHADDAAGKPLFHVRTEVTFEDVPGGTRMNVVQTYVFVDPSMAAPMVAGAPEGWRTTLDKLEKELLRMHGAAETVTRSVVHSTFQLTRTYDASVARVWKALTDEAAKEKWFGGTPREWVALERFMDVRVGGRERAKGRWANGIVSTFDATYHDVIPSERLVYTYEMHLNDKKISVSLATMQLKAAQGKTTLTVTEQGAFLDGYDDAGAREQGTNYLLDALGASLKD